MRNLRRLPAWTWVLALALALLPVAVSGLPPQSVEEFFLVSSLDAARGRMVLKRPTEVTLVMHVDGRTAYRDERGQPLTLRDLRTGDTVYITYRPNAGPNTGAEPTALLVRQGPMTVPELERRYLHLRGTGSF
jgi:hypothetical protein